MTEATEIDISSELLTLIVVGVVVSVFFVILGIIICLIVLYVYRKLTIIKCTCHKHLHGKTAIVTGGNSGIGYQIALALAGRGCRVIIADKDNCESTKNEIINATDNPNVIVKYLNLTSIKSIREFSQDINETEDRLDILINNAGIANSAQDYTNDELQVTMQVNHFGPFLLTHLLIGLLKKTSSSRIIFTGGTLTWLSNLEITNLNTYNKIQTWAPIFIYANSQLCNVLTTVALSRILFNFEIMHPQCEPPRAATALNIVLEGLIKNIVLKYYAKTAEEGAQSVIHVAISKETENVSGELFTNCHATTKPIKSSDFIFVRSIWEASEKFVGLTKEEQL
ncbi:hypothetical protein RN001_011746 [Aquatica leii]|uniref:Uncharacterized protein n=1 Tax=Aquatica leii TaxID=1421715 RepID=A0AAN7SER7_9COLE|nr:hypothetical protein RN001_011746 [Aquatica leii]